MLAVALGAFVVSWHLLFGVMVPGLLLNHFLHRFHSRSSDITAPITRIIGYGSILMVVELLVLQIATGQFQISIYSLVATKFVIELLLAIWAIAGPLRHHLIKWLHQFWKSLSPFDLALVAIALIYGFCSTLFFPYGHDNSAVAWISRFVVNPNVPLSASEGAPAYLGILVFPALILKGVAPVPTLAAGLKIPLSLLVAFVLRRFMNQMPVGIHRSSSALLAMLLLFTVFFSHYGLLRTGKETVFSIVLFFLFMAELIQRRQSDSIGNNVQTSLALAASVGFGAVSIPYALMLFLTLIWLEWAGGSKATWRPFRLTLTLILVTAIPIIVSVHSMLDRPWWLVCLLVGIPLLICFLLKDLAIPRLPIPLHVKKYVPAFSALAVLVLLTILMPVNYFLGYFPMDGESTILNVIDFNGTVGWLGIIGLITFFFSRFARTNFAAIAFALFPFVGLLLPLILARFPDAEIGVPKLKVWDLAKDIGNWILGFYSPIFASYFVVTAARIFAIGRQKKSGSTNALAIANKILIITVCLVAIYSSLKTFRRVSIPTYTQVGGHHDPILARYIETVYQKRFETNATTNFNSVWISQRSAFLQHRNTVIVYGFNAQVCDLVQIIDLFSDDDHQSVVAVLTHDELEKLKSETGHRPDQFQELVRNETDVIVLKTGRQ